MLQQKQREKHAFAMFISLLHVYKSRARCNNRPSIQQIALKYMRWFCYCYKM